MGLDWIDDTLQQAEGVPGLGGFAHDLRLVYEIWRKEPANPQPMRDQAHNLGDLNSTAAQLVNDFNESLLRLRQTWRGQEAARYLGPEATAFEIEHDLEPAGKGAGYLLWQNLAGVCDQLDYNAAAHHAAADKLQKIQEAHDQLNSDFIQAVITLGAMIGTAFIPVVDIFGEVAEGALETEEVATAVETGRTVQTLVETEVTVEKVVETYQLTRATIVAIKIYRMLVVVLGIQLIFWELRNGPNGNPGLLPSPDIYYPPGIAGDPEKERLYRLYLLQYGDALLAEYLVNSGLTPDQVKELIQAYGLEPLQALAKLLATNSYGLGNAEDFLNLYKARNVPGIKTVLQDILRSKSQAGLKGGLFELRWIAANANNIAQLQLPGKDSKGRTVKGPDAKLNDPAGTLIQLKSFTWGPNYNSRNFQEIIHQLDITRLKYPTEPIEFVFDSTGSNTKKTTQCLPASMIKRLEKAGIYPAGTPGATVTWNYWPPGNCPLPTHDPVQP